MCFDYVWLQKGSEGLVKNEDSKKAYLRAERVSVMKREKAKVSTRTLY